MFAMKFVKVNSPSPIYMAILLSRMKKKSNGMGKTKTKRKEVGAGGCS
jgi:hypothetical protein